MKVAGQQHYEIQPGEDYSALMEHWAEHMAQLLAACGNDRKVHLTLMMEATND